MYFLLATPTGSSFSCQNLIKRQTRPKFGGLLQYFMLTLARQCRVYAASIHMCVCVCMCVCMCVCVCVCVYIYVCIYVCVYMCVCICIYCVYVYIVYIGSPHNSNPLVSTNFCFIQNFLGSPHRNKTKYLKGKYRLIQKIELPKQTIPMHTITSS